MSKATTRLLAIEFLKANPQYSNYGPKRLRQIDDAPVCGVKTWERAREELGLPRCKPANRHTPKQQRKAAFALYPNTHKIVVDTTNLKIVFHGDNGFKVAEKGSKKALAASLRLFRLAKFETREHNTETGIMILTLKPEALEVVAAA